MTKKFISNAFRIAVAEEAIAQHRFSLRGRVHGGNSCSDKDASDLMRSIDLWATANGICLRIPRPGCVVSTAAGDGE
jgi:hypothetical protein